MKRLLIVVDYQNDFVDGTLGFDKAKAIEKDICNKIKEYKNNGDIVIFTLDTHEKDYLNTMEGKHLPVPHCIKDSEGWQLYGEVKALLLDSVTIEKETFGASKLQAYLLDKNFSSIELCGVVTNICVISNAVIAKACKPQTEIIIDAKCVASNDMELENKTFDVMENLHMSVINR